MKVNELIEALQKCRQDSDVFIGEPCKDVEDLNHVTEIGYSDEWIPSVYLYT